jgi:hypothetical protein
MTAPKLAAMAERPDDPPEYSHEQFYDDVIHIQPHEHAAWIGSTGKGKTTGMVRAMVAMSRIYPHIDYTIAVGKPHKGPKYRDAPEHSKKTGDETIARLVRQFGGKILREYPPMPRLPGQRKPTFNALWPLKGETPAATKAHHRAVIGAWLADRWNNGGGVVGADELVYLDDELDLEEYTDHLFRMGRGIDAPIWGGTQMPTFVNRKLFSMASHLVLNPDNDKDARRRYAEISSLDTDLVMWQLRRVQRYKFGALYIHTDAEGGPEWAILR